MKMPKVKNYISVSLVSAYIVINIISVVAQFFGKQIVTSTAFENLVSLVVGTFLGFQANKLTQKGEDVK